MKEGEVLVASCGYDTVHRIWIQRKETQLCSQPLGQALVSIENRGTSSFRPTYEGGAFLVRNR